MCASGNGSDPAVPKDQDDGVLCPRRHRCVCAFPYHAMEERRSATDRLLRHDPPRWLCRAVWVDFSAWRGPGDCALDAISRHRTRTAWRILCIDNVCHDRNDVPGLWLRFDCALHQSRTDGAYFLCTCRIYQTGKTLERSFDEVFSSWCVFVRRVALWVLDSLWGRWIDQFGRDWSEDYRSSYRNHRFRSRATSSPVVAWNDFCCGWPLLQDQCGAVPHVGAGRL